MSTVSLWVVVAFAFANPIGGKEPVTVTYDSHAVSYINDSGANSLSGPVFVASAKDISVDGTYIPPQSITPVYKSKDACLSAITMKNSLYHKEGNITLGCQEQKIEVPTNPPVNFRTSNIDVPTLGVEGSDSGLRISTDLDDSYNSLIKGMSFNSHGEVLAVVQVTPNTYNTPIGMIMDRDEEFLISCGDSNRHIANRDGVLTCLPE